MGLLPSRSTPDSEYLLTRLTAEARLAADARNGRAAAAHRAMASRYLAELFGNHDAPSPAVHTSARPHADVEVAQLRFATLTFAPENEELTSILAALL